MVDRSSIIMTNHGIAQSMCIFLSSLSWNVRVQRPNLVKRLTSWSIIHRSSYFSSFVCSTSPSSHQFATSLAILVRNVHRGYEGNQMELEPNKSTHFPNSRMTIRSLKRIFLLRRFFGDLPIYYIYHIT